MGVNGIRKNSFLIASSLVEAYVDVDADHLLSRVTHSLTENDGNLIHLINASLSPALVRRTPIGQQLYGKLPEDEAVLEMGVSERELLALRDIVVRGVSPDLHSAIIRLGFFRDHLSVDPLWNLFETTTPRPNG